MGLLDDLAGKALGSVLGGATGGSQGGELMSAVTGLINSQGGIGGLVQAFQNKGLGEVVGSWVSNGQNQPVSPSQLQDVLGPDAIAQIAQKLGIPDNAVTEQLTHLLPGVIDHLTPNGAIPQGVETIGLDMLKGMLTKGASGS